MWLEMLTDQFIKFVRIIAVKCARVQCRGSMNRILIVYYISHGRSFTNSTHDDPPPGLAHPPGVPARVVVSHGGWLTRGNRMERWHFEMSSVMFVYSQVQGYFGQINNMSGYFCCVLRMTFKLRMCSWTNLPLHWTFYCKAKHVLLYPTKGFEPVLIASSCVALSRDCVLILAYKLFSVYMI